MNQQLFNLEDITETKENLTLALSMPIYAYDDDSIQEKFQMGCSSCTGGCTSCYGSCQGAIQG
ncbi:hypothetical protein [Bacteroides sp. 519]|uniref:hypothetical protein n=1 Tax=Bacteroides sp. 519 TaxID=2302937 RepID=UPI0013D6B4FD|nr:hypothetical protein [Bacteroides sp. 519]NDV59106.1 hypothetical protein [Bacteroides sp. 519]